MSEVVVGIPAVIRPKGVRLPDRAHPTDAGLDLHCVDEVVLGLGERSILSTGLAVAIPAGFVGLVVGRSGLAADKGFVVLNSPGVIDSGYRGEIQVIVANLGSEVIQLEAGCRVAQLVVLPVVAARLFQVEKLEPSDRGSDGIGSTGL